MNSLFEEDIRGHHSMRDHLLTVVSDADLAYKLPGQNPTLGELLVEMGDIQGVYTHSFETFTLDWAHRELPAPGPITIAGLQAWFEAQDDAMKRALDRSRKRSCASTESIGATASSPRRSSSTRSTVRRCTSSTAS
jgi:hypothetical protein